MATRRFLTLGLGVIYPASLVLVACPLDERTLNPYQIQYIPQGGEGGDGSFEEPEAGTGGDDDDNGGDGNQVQAGEGGGGGSPSAGSGGGGGKASGGGSLSDGGEAGANNECPDLDGDTRPDCLQTLVENGSFDTDGSGWEGSGDIEGTWVPMDAGRRTDSGSLSVVNPDVTDSDIIVMGGVVQCLPLEPGRYTLIAQVKVEDGPEHTGGGVNVLFHGLPGCRGSVLGRAQGLVTPTGDWEYVTVEEDASFEMKSVSVGLVTTKVARSERVEARFDNVLFVRH